MNYITYFYNFSEVLNSFLEKCKLLLSLPLLLNNQDLKILLLACQQQDNTGYLIL